VRVKVARGTYSLQSALALSTAGLLASIMAILNPILTFDVAGDRRTGWMITGVQELFAQGYWPLAMLVFFASILAPLLYLASVWYVSAACFLRWRLPLVQRILGCIEALEPWNLVPVYAIATVVSVVKLRMLGTVEWDLGARWILGLALCSLLACQAFDDDLVAEKLRFLKGKRKNEKGSED
jgi:paraquat-inducible protein A